MGGCFRASVTFRPQLRVEGGIVKETKKLDRSKEAIMRADSLEADSLGILHSTNTIIKKSRRADIAMLVYSVGDSLASDSLGISLMELRSAVTVHRADSLER